MKIDSLLTKDPASLAGDAAARAEDFDGLWLVEAQYDPFLQCLEVSRAAPGVPVGTAIAVAFARSPMTVASSAYDLARYCEGTFTLGLGPQIKPHIERRFSMPWSHPARRMREFVLALRAIWACWQHAEPLEFRGEFYRHTLMTPNFMPPPHPWGPPPVYLAGVGARMTEVAGEVADGFLMHQFMTGRYLREVTVPALDRGAALAGGGRARPEIGGLAFVATGRDDAELDAAIAAVRYRVAFYGSTPAYKPVLDLHGWGELQVELNALTKQGRWEELPGLVPDEVLHELAAVGRPEEVTRLLAARYGGLVDRIAFDMPYRHHLETQIALARALRAAAP